MHFHEFFPTLKPLHFHEFFSPTLIFFLVKLSRVKEVFFFWFYLAAVVSEGLLLIMSPNRWALLYRTDIGASGGRFSKNSLCLKAAVWIQPRPHCRRRGRQRARRRAPLEGVRAPKRRSTSSLWVRKGFSLSFWKIPKYCKKKLF